MVAFAHHEVIGPHGPNDPAYEAKIWSAVELTPNEWDELGTESAQVWFFAKLTFADFMDDPHSIGFCWRWEKMDPDSPTSYWKWARVTNAPSAYTEKT
jgi:hypothetical protein